MSNRTPEIDAWIDSYKANPSHMKPARKTPTKTLAQRVAEAKRRGFSNVLVTIDQAEMLFTLRGAE